MQAAVSIQPFPGLGGRWFPVEEKNGRDVDSDSGMETPAPEMFFGHGCSVMCVFFVILVLRVSVWLVAPRSPMARPTSVPMPAPVSPGMSEMP